jgi:phosphopantothenoylcysteine decarboxylase/phosphopantothenate--cysteine ligase
MHFLITAGGTREYIDPVRFISNASSGRMGDALSRAAAKAGHKVTLVTAALNPRSHANCRMIRVETGEEMFAAVKKYFRTCDCLIMAAAVCDYKPAKQAKTKIKKSRAGLTIELMPTVDILKWTGEHKKKGQIVVGFALEDRHLRRRAQEKLRAKNIDMIVANTPAAIGAEKSTVQIKTSEGPWRKIENARKSVIARKIIRHVIAMAGL